MESWEEVELKPLSLEDAKKVLKACVTNEERKFQLHSPDLDTIAKLCGFVPLALSIVGSHLSDFSAKSIIENLEKEPMDILEGNSESFCKAIANSFDLLKEDKQDALIALSVFPGSFDYNAAEAALQECSKSNSIPILNSLKNRSLVEQAGFERYKLHPLIRAFAKMIGETKSRHVLQNTNQLACVHFLSRLEENARVLY